MERMKKTKRLVAKLFEKSGRDCKEKRKKRENKKKMIYIRVLTNVVRFTYTLSSYYRLLSLFESLGRTNLCCNQTRRVYKTSLLSVTTLTDAKKVVVLVSSCKPTLR